MKTRGAVACGHQETAAAAQLVLREGGNAFDAIIAAFFTCCVVEPVLASLGGGGFLLAHAKGRRNVIYDFLRRRRSSLCPQTSWISIRFTLTLAQRPRSSTLVWLRLPRQVR